MYLSKGNGLSLDQQGSQEDLAENVYVHLGRRLRQIRKSKGMTQSEVARVIDVSPQQYQKYEDAQSKCSLTSLMKLGAFYGEPVAALLPPETWPEGTRPGDETLMTTEADLLARLVGAFVQLDFVDEKLRVVQLVEAIVTAQGKR